MKSPRIQEKKWKTKKTNLGEEGAGREKRGVKKNE